ncbi:hypothetical protein AB1N83_012700 [Pleurotus pulmonarius]
MDPVASVKLYVFLRPRFIIIAAGICVSYPLYGLALAQTIFYYRTFTNDVICFKIVVAMLLILNTVHFIALVQQQHIAFFQVEFASIRPLTPGVGASLFSMYLAISIVQWSYARRIWTLSDGNKILAGILVFLPTVQLASGMSVATIQTIFTSRNEFGAHTESCTIMCTAEAWSSIVCDLLISTSVAYYLAKRRKGFRRRENLLPRIAFYVISTGLVTSIAAFMVAALWQFFPTTTAFLSLQTVITRLYVNSLLASLNARVDFA